MRKVWITLFAALLAVSQAVIAAPTTREVDVDGSKLRFEYSMAPTKEGHKASLSVTDADKRELWSHSWEVNKFDLSQMMDEEGRSSADDWARRFFDNTPFERPTFERRKLTAQELVPSYLDFYAEKLKVPVAELKAAILQPKVNFLFVYRAAWREDFLQLVYVPKYRRFVVFRGYGESGEE